MYVICIFIDKLMKRDSSFKVKLNSAPSWGFTGAQPRLAAPMVAEQHRMNSFAFALALWPLFFLIYTGLCESRNVGLLMLLLPTETLQWFVYGRDLLVTK